MLWEQDGVSGIGRWGSNRTPGFGAGPLTGRGLTRGGYLHRPIQSPQSGYFQMQCGGYLSPR